MRGIERRVADGPRPERRLGRSLFVSRWDVAVSDEVPDELKNRLGIAAAIDGYVAYRELIESDRWLRLENEGARPQRFLFASTGTKDPSLPKTTYVEAFAAPLSVDTMPEDTLLALARGRDGRRAAPRRRRRQRRACWPSSSAAGVDLEGARRAAPGRGRRQVREELERALLETASAAKRAALVGRAGRRLDGSGSTPRTRAMAVSSTALPAPGPSSSATTPTIGERHLRELFAADPERGERLVAEAAGLRLDYSKHRITDETLALLVRARRGGRAARADPGDVRRRAHQRHRGPRRCSTSRCGCRASAR